MKTNSQNFKIVLTDDDTEDCEIFNEALKMVRPEVELEILHNGKELLDHLHDHPADLPDLVLLDLNMPIMDGMESMAALRSDPLLKDLRVVIFSTSSSGDDIERSRIEGADGFICKPTCFNKLLNIIRMVLDTDWNGKDDGTGKTAPRQFHIAL